MKLKIDELNKMSPAAIVEDDRVEKRFVSLYNSIHGSKVGESIYTKEKFNFLKLISEKPDLMACTRLSLYGCFLDIAVNALSLDPTGRPHCYIIPRSAKTGLKTQDGKDVYEKRAYLYITGYGELYMRKRAGHIKHCDNPVIVYEGDTFEVTLNEIGVKTINYKAVFPRKSEKIIGVFMRIIRNDDSIDFKWLLEGDIKRLMAFSDKNNNYGNATPNMTKANALYTSNNGQIDIGFLENKVIKHAFSVYPKIRSGEFTVFQELNEEPKTEELYGMELPKQLPDETQEYAQVEPYEPEAKPEPKKESEIF